MFSIKTLRLIDALYTFSILNDSSPIDVFLFFFVKILKLHFEEWIGVIKIDYFLDRSMQQLLRECARINFSAERKSAGERRSPVTATLEIPRTLLQKVFFLAHFEEGINVIL